MRRADVDTWLGLLGDDSVDVELAYTLAAVPRRSDAGGVGSTVGEARQCLSATVPAGRLLMDDAGEVYLQPRRGGAAIVTGLAAVRAEIAACATWGHGWIVVGADRGGEPLPGAVACGFCGYERAVGEAAAAADDAATCHDATTERGLSGGLTLRRPGEPWFAPPPDATIDRRRDADADAQEALAAAGQLYTALVEHVSPSDLRGRGGAPLHGEVVAALRRVVAAAPRAFVAEQGAPPRLLLCAYVDDVRVATMPLALADLPAATVDDLRAGRGDHAVQLTLAEWRNGGAVRYLRLAAGTTLPESTQTLRIAADPTATAIDLVEEATRSYLGLRPRGAPIGRDVNSPFSNVATSPLNAQALDAAVESMRVIGRFGDGRPLVDPPYRVSRGHEWAMSSDGRSTTCLRCGAQFMDRTIDAACPFAPGAPAQPGAVVSGSGEPGTVAWADGVPVGVFTRRHGAQEITVQISGSDGDAATATATQVAEYIRRGAAGLAAVASPPAASRSVFDPSRTQPSNPCDEVALAPSAPATWTITVPLPDAAEQAADDAQISAHNIHTLLEHAGNAVAAAVATEAAAADRRTEARAAEAAAHLLARAVCPRCDPTNAGGVYCERHLREANDRRAALAAGGQAQPHVWVEQTDGTQRCDDCGRYRDDRVGLTCEARPIASPIAAIAAHRQALAAAADRRALAAAADELVATLDPDATRTARAVLTGGDVATARELIGTVLHDPRGRAIGTLADVDENGCAQILLGSPRRGRSFAGPRTVQRFAAVTGRSLDAATRDLDALQSRLLAAVRGPRRTTDGPGGRPRPRRDA